jgi:ParB family chromosome partitioning protein
VTAALKVVKDRAHDIPLECLHESPFNKRRNFGDLDELADSFRSVGVLQDVLARPHPEKEGEYELVFGHRRFRAAKLAELVAIPAKVKTLTDEQVCDAIIIENGQRENIHPLEEAETFEQSMRVQRLSAEGSRSEDREEPVVRLRSTQTAQPLREGAPSFRRRPDQRIDRALYRPHPL